MANATISGGVGVAAQVYAASASTGATKAVEGRTSRVRIEFLNEDASNDVYVDTEGADDITKMHLIPAGTDPGNPFVLTSLPMGGDLSPTQDFYLRCDTAQTANVRITEVLG